MLLMLPVRPWCRCGGRRRERRRRFELRAAIVSECQHGRQWWLVGTNVNAGAIHRITLCCAAMIATSQEAKEHRPPLLLEDALPRFKTIALLLFEMSQRTTSGGGTVRHVHVRTGSSTYSSRDGSGGQSHNFTRKSVPARLVVMR